MPTLTLRPNESQDYYGLNYVNDNIFKEYARARNPQVASESIVNQQTKDTPHIKINQQKINKQLLNKSADIDKQNVDGRPAFTTPEQQHETNRRPNLETSIGDKEDMGDDYSQILEKLGEEDISLEQSFGSKVYSVGESVVSGVGESGTAILNRAKDSVVSGIMEKGDLEGKWKELKTESKEEIVKFKAELREDANRKYDNFIKETKGEADKLQDTIKSASYLAVGGIFLFLLMKK